MYKSPIEIFQTEIEMQMEGEILRAVQRVGVSVDKEELLKALKYDRDQYSKGYEDAKKESRWIPVSERLPEEGEKCIVTDKRGYVHDGITYDYAEDKDDKPSFHKWDNEYWNCFVYDIIAWQPLPEPYNGE